MSTARAFAISFRVLSRKKKYKNLVLELVPLMDEKKNQATPTKQDLAASQGFVFNISIEHSFFYMGVPPDNDRWPKSNFTT